MERKWQNDAAALCLAPLAATVPLIAFFSAPFSPLYLGKLMGEAAHPFNRPWIGPLVSAMAVVFDGQILGSLMVLFLVAPVYAALRARGHDSFRNLVTLGGAAGIVGSQIARMISQGFRQPDLREFANSWQSPAIGCLCGLAAGVFIAYFGRRMRLSGPVCMLPLAAWAVSAAVIVWSAQR
jgi:hypothetical protein